MTDLDTEHVGGAVCDKPAEQDASAVWQPYVDPPLLTPRMVLGFNEATHEEQTRLLRYLAALVDARKAPVHVNVAFNAVYFGFDLTARGYVGGALHDLFSFPEIHAGEESEALPVGALVKIAAGARPLFAEVVYKEGAHAALEDDGALPGWLSGAPAGASGPAQTDSVSRPSLRELLVVDTDAFGQDFSMTNQQLERVKRAGRAMNADGHLVHQARYASCEDADLDDVSYYARYLLTRGRAQLLSASAPAALGALLTPDAGEEQYRLALLGLLSTVQSALEQLDDRVRMWHGYAFTRRGFGDRLGYEGPLGGSDLELVAAQLRRSAIPDRPSRWSLAPKPSYTAIGPRLRQFGGAERQLAGVGYPSAICHANAVISDYVRGESDESTGLLSGGVSLGLDDPWQGGGVWRAAAPGGSEAQIDITQPLGLGWASTLPDAGSEEEPEIDNTGEQPDEPLDLSLRDSEISWSQPLRLKHVLEGYLPLPEGAASAMRASVSRLRLMLTHAGHTLDGAHAFQDTTTDLFVPQPRISGIDWPLEFFPGIVLTCTWPRGASVVRATSTLLETPVTVDGELIEHRYDTSILTRDAAPGEGRRGPAGAESSTRSPGTLTLQERVLRAVRRLGLLERDGRAVLTRSRLTGAVYGELSGGDPGAERMLEEAIVQLLHSGRLRSDVGGVDEQGLLCFPAAPQQRNVEVLVYEPLVEVAPSEQRPTRANQDVDRFVRATDVAGHLRRIGHLGRVASEEKKAAYAKERQRLGYGSAELPPGFTYVPAFTRGG